MNVHKVLIMLSLIMCTGCINFGSSRSITHKVIPREDGGYEITLNGTKRIYQPITAEGFFPVEQLNYKISLIGKGKEWSFRAQPGYYYSFPTDIKSAKCHWDFGYIWVDKNRETISINLYWVKAPDSLLDADINGSYIIQSIAEQSVPGYPPQGVGSPEP